LLRRERFRHVGGASVTNDGDLTTNATLTHTRWQTGATGTIVLTNNGGDLLTLEATPFTFTTPVVRGQS
jgi:hypothetical protein